MHPDFALEVTPGFFLLGKWSSNHGFFAKALAPMLSGFILSKFPRRILPTMTPFNSFQGAIAG
jgi:hypothetical protein